MQPMMVSEPWALPDSCGDDGVMAFGMAGARELAT